MAGLSPYQTVEPARATSHRRIREGFRNNLMLIFIEDVADTLGTNDICVIALFAKQCDKLKSSGEHHLRIVFEPAQPSGELAVTASF